MGTVSQILLLVWCFKLMVFGPWGGVPSVCLAGIIWVSVGDVHSERFRGAGRLPVFKFCMYCLYEAEVKIQFVTDLVRLIGCTSRDCVNSVN